MHAKTLLDIAMEHSESLIERAIEGNEISQSRLVKLWFKRIYNYALKYLSDHDLAMDVAQKTFIGLYEKIGGLRDSSRFKPWLYRIATNYCHEELRSAKTQMRYFSRHNSESNSKKADGAMYNPQQLIERRQINEFLQEALLTLSEDQREVVIMKEYEGLKFKEIAEILNESENTVKSRLYYGLTHLRKHFQANKISKETLQL